MNAPVAPCRVLLREDQDDIAVLVLNRPQARNSLSEALIAALTESLAAIADRHARARRRAGGERPGLLAPATT